MSIVLRKVKLESHCTIYAMGSKDDCELFTFLEKMQADDENEFDKINALLDHTATYGPPRNTEKCRWFSDIDVFELKTKGGIRIMAFWDKNRIIICTHGFLKKKQKTPKNEKTKAKNEKARFLEAKAAKTITIDKGGRYDQ